MISYDYAADDHAAEMADLRNDAEAADAQWRCCKCRRDCEVEAATIMSARVSLCCGWSAYRADSTVSPLPATPEAGGGRAVEIIANASRDASLRGEYGVAQDLLRAAMWLQGRAA